MKNQNTRISDIAMLLLRLALAAGFLSAVVSRLGLWGKYSSGWSNFLRYSSQVNSFAPKNLIPAISITSTLMETCLGMLLLVGYRTKYAAFGAAVLSFLFALAMSYSFGIKEPFDYSVFVFSAGAFLLATMTGNKWSIDSLLNKKILKHKTLNYEY